MRVIPRNSGSRRRVAIALSVLAGIVSLLASTAATASTASTASSASTASARGPAAPTGVHVASVSGTSVTIVADPADRAQSYRVYISPVKSDLYIVNMTARRVARRVVSATDPTVTVTSLPYVAAPYWYRVATVNGPKLRYSTLRSADLRPATPTALGVMDGPTGVSLLWKSGPVTGFAIIQATDPAFLHNRRTYTVRGDSTQFSPFGLAKGTTYWYRVRASNGSVGSSYSNEVSATVSTREQGVRVMTYNILRMASDGTKGGDSASERIAPWVTGRKAAAALLIKAANPDVIGIQEGAAWVGRMGSPRQVDSLLSALGFGFSLARTEVPPTEHGYFRVGDYIIYRNSTWRAVGQGGHWQLDALPTWAAFQVLQNKNSAATFLVVSAHLTPGVGAAYDRARQTETARLVALARSQASTLGGLPIVYAGDYNSYLAWYHSFDGPGRAAHATHLSDGFLVAQSMRNQQYNSSNRYLRTPPANGYSLDHIYADPGVAIRRWAEVLHLSKGRVSGVIASDHNPVVADLSIRY